MILTSSQAFVGSQNFSDSSMDDNRELGLITSDSSLRASLSRTFDGDYAKAAPYASGGGTVGDLLRHALDQPAAGAAAAAGPSARRNLDQ